MTRTYKKHWIPKVHLKKGALHRQLGLSPSTTIPYWILHDIKDKKVGQYQIVNVRELDGVVDKKVKVTPLLKKRVQFALNVRR